MDVGREEKDRLIFEAAAIGISIGLPDGRVADVNPCFCEMFGYEREELVGRFSLDFGYPEDAEITTGAINRLLSGETDSVSYEKRYLRKDGSVFWSHTTVAAVRGPEADADGCGPRRWRSSRPPRARGSRSSRAPSRFRPRLPHRTRCRRPPRGRALAPSG